MNKLEAKDDGEPVPSHQNRVRVTCFFRAWKLQVWQQKANFEIQFSRIFFILNLFTFLSLHLPKEKWVSQSHSAQSPLRFSEWNFATLGIDHSPGMFQKVPTSTKQYAAKSVKKVPSTSECCQSLGFIPVFQLGWSSSMEVCSHLFAEILKSKPIFEQQSSFLKNLSLKSKIIFWHHSLEILKSKICIWIIWIIFPLCFDQERILLQRATVSKSNSIRLMDYPDTNQVNPGTYKLIFQWCSTYISMMLKKYFNDVFFIYIFNCIENITNVCTK